MIEEEGKAGEPLAKSGPPFWYPRPPPPTRFLSRMLLPKVAISGTHVEAEKSQDQFSLQGDRQPKTRRSNRATSMGQPGSRQPAHAEVATRTRARQETVPRRRTYRRQSAAGADAVINS
jgi:ubiquitin-protein ligase